MGVSAGPNITRDGLLVYYDIANINSYRGEATTNLVNPDWTTWSLDASGFTTTGTRTILSTYYIRITDVNANARHSTWIYSLSANTTYTFSVGYKRISGTPTLRYQIQFYNGGSYLSAFFPTTTQIGIVDSGEWQVATYTVTTPSNTDRILWFIQDGDDYTGYTHTFELKEPQAEAKSYANTFVVGTRGTTVAAGGGVRSLLSTSNAEVVNGASYSNTFGGILNLDGTNDHVRLPSITTTTLSVSVWVRSSSWSTQTHPMIVAKGINVEWILWKSDDSSYDEKFGWRSSSGSNIYSTTTAQNNTWYHLLATVGAAGQRLYVNGVLEASNGTTSVPSGSLEICIGAGLSGGNPGNFLLGNISSMKIWNRQLSATEVMTDYLTTRTRFFTRETAVTTSLILSLDAGNISSYKGSGTTWTDLSGYGINGTLVNGPTFRGAHGGAITLDGINDYVVFAKNSNFYSSYWTWEFCIRFNSNTGTYQGIVWAEGAAGGGSGYQYLLSVYNNTYFHYRISNSVTGWTNTDTSNIDFSLTRFNHIVWQFNNGTTTIYVNGSLWHTNSTRGSYNGGTDSPMYIASRNDVDYLAPISMGVCKFYNRVISASEIQQNYNATKSRFVI
jgi:hypothetical protein